MIGTRHGEKLYETLLTREEFAVAEDLGDYFPGTSGQPGFELFTILQMKAAKRLRLKRITTLTIRLRKMLTKCVSCSWKLECVQQALRGEKVEL